MDLDAEKIMLRLAETQKAYVREDLAGYNEAMVAIFPAEGSSYVQFPTFEDWESKHAAYSAIVERAKANQAVLIITVNRARTAKATENRTLETYEWGDLKSGNSDPCILLTASGPGLQSCSLEIPFSILGAEVSFGKPGWMFDLELNLLPDWP